MSLRVSKMPMTNSRVSKMPVAMIEGLKDVGDKLKDLDDAGDDRDAALVPASAQARPEHSLEEDSFKT